MLYTYEAILKGNELEWLNDKPEIVNGNNPVRVQVTLLDTDSVKKSDGKNLAEILEELARLDPFKDITDPVEWQREIRRERPLPGREP
ncbi:MAG: hypothetical protein AAB209_01410 [Bacteroidota bacterium]|jgi:hypothetical protein